MFHLSINKDQLIEVIYRSLQQTTLNKTEQDTDLTTYRSLVVKDLLFLYVFGIVVCSVNFLVGIIWQSIDISAFGSGSLQLPYFGGYIILVSAAMALIFVYNLISLKNEANTMKFQRRFQLVLSVIIFLATLVLTIILCIRANDYRKQSSALTRLKYGTAILCTVIAILLTIVAAPVYLHIIMITYNTVKLTPDDEQQTESGLSVVIDQEPNDGYNRPQQVKDQAKTLSKEYQCEQQLIPRKKCCEKLMRDDRFQYISKESQRRLSITYSGELKKCFQQEPQKNIVLSQQIERISQ